MSDSLFDAADEDRRSRLRSLGYREAGCFLFGAPCWYTPDGTALLTEKEALLALERHEKEQKERGPKL